MTTTAPQHTARCQVLGLTILHGHDADGPCRDGRDDRARRVTTGTLYRSTVGSALHTARVLIHGRQGTLIVTPYWSTFTHHGAHLPIRLREDY